MGGGNQTIGGGKKKDRSSVTIRQKQGNKLEVQRERRRKGRGRAEKQITGTAWGGKPGVTNLSSQRKRGRGFDRGGKRKIKGPGEKKGEDVGQKITTKGVLTSKGGNYG